MGGRSTAPPRISIHATHTGGDVVRQAYKTDPAFQSTPPIRVATITSSENGADFGISIHATHTGGDLKILCLYLVRRDDFNPRHPYGWRPEQSRAKEAYPLFQSTPPIRVATPPSRRFSRIDKFQSTPPIRVATPLDRTVSADEYISIHATHTGGDRPWSSKGPAAVNFNPRHPYGWRRTGRLFVCQNSVFQSTPPIRVAT